MRRFANVFIALILGAAMAVPITNNAAAQSGITVYVDGQLVNFDMPPMMVQGRVLVPLRGIFERLGATVDYDARTQHIVAVRGEQTVELTLGSRQARVNEAPTLLDVPATAIGGRTMVPLRFISEALGASVQWVDASRTILIGSSGAAASAPPPVPQPQPQPQPQRPSQSQTLSGRLLAVSTGDNPRIVVRGGDQDRTISVMPETAIFRYNVDTNVGGSAPLGALRKGDQVTVDVNAQNQATKITATYRVPAAGKITTVNASTRTVTLEDGRAYVVLTDADITLDGKAADFTAIQAQRIARFSVIEGTNQAYEVRVSLPAASTPPPATVAAPTIMAPASGATVGSTFPVKGKAQAGALVVVKVQPRLLGQSAQVQTTAAADGSWAVNVSVSSLPFVAFPYVLSAVQIVKGTQSDPASVEVMVQ